MDHLNAIAQGFGASPPKVADVEGRAALKRALVHHQSVTGRAITAQYTLQRHLAIVADVVAIDRQAVGGTAAGTGHINQAAVMEGGQLAGSEGADAALADQQHAAAVDIQGASAGAGIAEFEIPGQAKTRAIVQVDRFPVGVALGVGRLGVVKRQGIVAQAAINQGGGGEGGLRQVLQECGVVIRAHIDCRVDRAGADPVELIVAKAHEHLAVDHAAGQGKQIIAAADTDVTADIPPEMLMVSKPNPVTRLPLIRPPSRV